MGQSPVLACVEGADALLQRFANTVPRLSVFATDLGWFGLVGRGDTTIALSLGHSTQDAVRDAVARLRGFEAESARFAECDWFPRLRRRLQAYCRGGRDDFDDCRIHLTGLTHFQRRVLLRARRIRYGTLLSYGELAAKVGSRGAARAVGQAMAANPVPILVPCHRVVGANGALGGFSAPGGIHLKQRLLAMEGALMREEIPS